MKLCASLADPVTQSKADNSTPSWGLHPSAGPDLKMLAGKVCDSDILIKSVGRSQGNVVVGGQAGGVIGEDLW